jgi:hypothetical protein
MNTIIQENINIELEPIAFWSAGNTERLSTVRLAEWTVNHRLEVVKVVCEVRQ